MVSGRYYNEFGDLISKEKINELKQAGLTHSQILKLYYYKCRDCGKQIIADRVWDNFLSG